MKKYNNQQICKCCLAYRKGTPVTKLVEQFDVPRSTIYFWLKKYKDMPSLQPESYISFRQNFKREQKRNEKLANICEILQKVDCTVSAPLKTRLYALESLYGQYSVHHLCEALKVSRGTFYNHVLRNKKEKSSRFIRKEEMKELIQGIYDESNGIYGARKIHYIMVRAGHTISLKFVKQLMQEMNLKSIRDTMKRQFLREQYLKKKNLLQNVFFATRPNEKWVGDITQFYCQNKKFYICAILDLFSRKIVAYKISTRCSTQLVTTTFKIAYANRNPVDLIFHSDGGGQYISYTYQKLLSDLGVTQSFSRPRRPEENSVMESFFATLKKEELYRRKYNSIKEFKDSIGYYIAFYNSERPHERFRYLTPNEKEEAYKKSNA